MQRSESERLREHGAPGTLQERLGARGELHPVSLADQPSAITERATRGSSSTTRIESDRPGAVAFSAPGWTSAMGSTSAASRITMRAPPSPGAPPSTRGRPQLPPMMSPPSSRTISVGDGQAEARRLARQAARDRAADLGQHVVRAGRERLGGRTECVRTVDPVRHDAALPSGDGEGWGDS